MVRVLLACLLPVGVAQAADNGGDAEACTKGQVEVAQRAAAFQGEAQIKRLIDADLARARKEEAEGDADECVEALDHARKLLAGQY